MKVNLPENKSILPMMYISIYEDGKVIDYCVKTLETSIQSCFFEKTKSTIYIKLKLQDCFDSTRIVKDIFKEINETYVSRIVLLGVRNFKTNYLTQKLQIKVRMNDEIQVTQKLQNDENANIMEIFDFIVNQYHTCQYIFIDIYDSTLLLKKIGECRITLKNESVDNKIINEEFSNRDDIPKYLQNRILLRESWESYCKSNQPFYNWVIKNKENKNIGNLMGYVRKFDMNSTKLKIISLKSF